LPEAVDLILGPILWKRFDRNLMMIIYPRKFTAEVEFVKSIPVSIYILRSVFVVSCQLNISWHDPTITKFRPNLSKGLKKPLT
jgi:hypothetical protein